MRAVSAVDFRIDARTKWAMVNATYHAVRAHLERHACALPQPPRELPRHGYGSSASGGGSRGGRGNGSGGGGGGGRVAWWRWEESEAAAAARAAALPSAAVAQRLLALRAVKAAAYEVLTLLAAGWLCYLFWSTRRKLAA